MKKLNPQSPSFNCGVSMPPFQQRGAVIIITLWTVILMTVLITVIASQNRLSARAAFYHQEDLEHWASIVAAVNQAEMELVMERMPRPPETLDDLDDVGRNPAYRYNGDEVELAYAAPEGITVRIYDHAGKINLREISRPRMRALLEKRLGANQNGRIDQMMDAWNDWLDLNDAAGINGAEIDYYTSLDDPYTPRNGRFETVDEILHIRGFDEAFAGINMEAAFTLYGENELVNLNMATVEAMRLLPGLDDELIERILAYRSVNEFSGNGDVIQIIPQENMVELRNWLNNRKITNYYTILAYRPILSSVVDDFTGEGVAEEEFTQDGLLPADRDVSSVAYSQTVEVRGNNQRPRVIRINPYERIPVRVELDPEADYGF